MFLANGKSLLIGFVSPGLFTRSSVHGLALVIVILFFIQGVSAAPTSLHLQKIAADGKTVLIEKNLDYLWMEQNLPVQGDGVVHYYH